MSYEHINTQTKLTELIINKKAKTNIDNPPPSSGQRDN